jgi:F0F1-type ATP synthase alpha subunit
LILNENTYAISSENNPSRYSVGEQLKFANSQKVGIDSILDTENAGKIVNYRGDVIQGEAKPLAGKKVPIYTRWSKLPRRKIVENQLFTGNIAIDFTSPIARGQYVCFNGEANTGNQGYSKLSDRKIFSSC